MSSDDKQPLLNQPTAPPAYGPPSVPHHGGYGTAAVGPPHLAATASHPHPVDPPPAYGGPPPPGQVGYGPPPPGQAGYGPPPGQAGYGGPPPGQAGYGPPPGQAGYGPPPGQAGYGPPPGQAGYHGHGPPVYQPQVYQPGVPPSCVVIQTVNYGATPVQVRCPNCHQNVITELSYTFGSLVWVIVGIMFLVGLLILPLLWFFCWIPLLINGLKDVQHSCPNCHHVCGTYKRM